MGQTRAALSLVGGRPPGKLLPPQPGQRRPSASTASTFVWTPGCEMTKAQNSPAPPRLPYSSVPDAFVVDVLGRPARDIVATALGALCNLDHRGASGAEVNTGDGAPRWSRLQ